MLISAVISILEDFGSLLPARTVTVKHEPEELLSVIISRSLSSQSYRRVNSRVGFNLSNSCVGFWTILSKRVFFTLPIMACCA